MTGNQKKIVVAAVAMIAFTWWAATSPDSPINPTPPRPSRPVLRRRRAIARVRELCWRIERCKRIDVTVETATPPS